MSAQSQSPPPAFAMWLLKRVVPEHLREAMIGDLEEMYHAKITSGVAERTANRWFWREALSAPRTLLTRNQTPHITRELTGDSVVTLFGSDVKFAWRMLLRRPGFTVLSVATLALGIGATTAIFSAVYPILFESLPYPRADQLSMVWEGTNTDDKSNIGYSTFADIAEQNHSFVAMAAMAYASATMTGKGEPQFLQGQRVSLTFFSVLGIPPAIGRDFRAEDNVRGTQRVILLSHSLWRLRFSGDSTIVGKPITLDGNSFIVLGVMPEGFENVLNPSAQFWTPLRYERTLPQACRSCRHLRAIARRRADVTPAQASRDVNAISTRFTRDFPQDYARAGMMVPKLGDEIVRGVRPALLAVLGAVALVLLVACLNVMNLLLARGAQREAEFAVRAALGAGRLRIVRQLLSESVMLAVFSGIAGVGVALVGVRALVALSPANLPRLSAIHVNAPVLLFAIAVTTLVGVFFGLIPGLYATRRNLYDGIRRSGPRTAGTSRFTRSALVISEVALAMVLLVGSGLLFRSMERLFAVNPGFDSNQLLTLQIQSGAGRLRSDTLVAAFFDDALKAVRNQPGVVSAALTSQLPLSGDFDSYGVQFQNSTNERRSEDHSSFRYGVSDGYFETMKIPLVQGRLFTSADREKSALVAIISESSARKQFGNASALGHRIRLGGDERPWREIVGVVGDVKQTSLAAELADGFYVPERQWFFVDNSMSMVVRTKTNALSMVQTLRNAIWAVDKDQPFIRIATADELMADRAAERRFAQVLFESFSVLALILAAAGIYGVLAGTVSERIRELGVRAALGANGRDLVLMVLRQGLSLTGVGVVTGIAAALASSRVIEGMLFNISPLDVSTYAGVSAALVGVALLACWIPARRASHASPMEALRAE